MLRRFRCLDLFQVCSSSLASSQFDSVQAIASLQAAQLAAISSRLCLLNRLRALCGLLSLSSSPSLMHSARQCSIVAVGQLTIFLASLSMVAFTSASKNFFPSGDTFALTLVVAASEVH